MRLTQSQNFETSQGTAELHVTVLPGIKAGRLIMRLAKTLGPAVGKITAAMQGKGDVGDAVTELSDRLSEAEFEHVLLELMTGARAQVNGEFIDMNRASIDNLFRGVSEEMFSAMWFALKVNYENFFNALAAQVKKITPATGPKPSPIESSLKE